MVAKVIASIYIYIYDFNGPPVASRRKSLSRRIDPIESWCALRACASCVGETEWQWTISAFEDSLSPPSSFAKSRQRFFFPPPIRWVLFFFLFQIRNKGRNEVIKKRLYPWDIKVRSKWESVYSDCNIILFFLFLLKILRYSGAEIY